MLLLYSLEVVESVDEPCEMSLTLVLLLQPGASEPVPGVVILGPGLGAHVDHELHAGGHLLLHLQRQHQGLQQNKDSHKILLCPDSKYNEVFCYSNCNKALSAF